MMSLRHDVGAAIEVSRLAASWARACLDQVVVQGIDPLIECGAAINVRASPGLSRYTSSDRHSARMSPMSVRIRIEGPKAAL
ncbi:hypothetical protein EOA33_21100 [Mesorhizobium sp. M4A.F.Ca.ET.050.02.1.1]|uniref:hypothetical protein n=1 Tax=Mesorhizobium sp. M4A.F.Ca.ET.050.02.1.1 TaxID=2496754 RepID=UPI000FC9BC15|nr:hypothetical protein [Mesorhizobium sp. M4A.F.Ca.ET.050.02.1.1]RUX46487.1 hypothetical protein EOA33_21100 [Mesorhizobium sp. M4A.F.Ca.ET.050.02.1.1]